MQSRIAVTNKRYLTPQEVADLLMVSPVTVRQWAQRGLLAAVTTAGGHRRFSPETVARFARQRGIEVPSELSGVRRILLVDDDRQLNSFLVDLLQVHGGDRVAIESAYDGFEAGSKVHRFRPDVILLDLKIPGLDGFEVCRRLKGDPDTEMIEIIAMTGHYAPAEVDRIVAAGAARFLRKPFSNREVLYACGLLEERAMRSDAVGG